MTEGAGAGGLRTGLYVWPTPQPRPPRKGVAPSPFLRTRDSHGAKKENKTIFPLPEHAAIFASSRITRKGLALHGAGWCGSGGFVWMESCPETHRGPSHGFPVTVRHRVTKVRQSPRKRVEMAISDGEGQPSGASMEQAYKLRVLKRLVV